MEQSKNRELNDGHARSGKATDRQALKRIIAVHDPSWYFTPLMSKVKLLKGVMRGSSHRKIVNLYYELRDKHRVDYEDLILVIAMIMHTAMQNDESCFNFIKCREDFEDYRNRLVAGAGMDAEPRNRWSQFMTKMGLSGGTRAVFDLKSPLAAVLDDDDKRFILLQNAVNEYGFTLPELVFFHYVDYSSLPGYDMTIMELPENLLELYNTIMWSVDDEE